MERILAVDDRTGSRLARRDFVLDEGCGVETAHDVQKPELDGLSMVSDLRQKSNFRDLLVRSGITRELERGFTDASAWYSRRPWTSNPDGNHLSLRRAIRVGMAMMAAAVAIGAIGACKGESAARTPVAQESDSNAKGTRPVAPDTISDHMRDHFDRSHDLLAAVIADNRTEARRHSAWFADHRTHPSLSRWEEEIEQFRSAARPGALLVGIVELGGIVANVGAACGDCHVATDHVAVFAEVDKPVLDVVQGIDRRMLAHQWAADRMWEGLTGPSDELWDLGADALVLAPLHSDEILKNSTAAHDIVSQARLVHDLGREARRAGNSAARAEVFGRFLSKCASCHIRVGATDQTSPSHDAGAILRGL